MSNMWWNFKQMRESALGSVFIFQKRAIGLDNYKSKESLSRVVVTLKMYFQKTQMTCYQKYREIKQQKLMVQQVRLFKRAIILG